MTTITQNLIRVPVRHLRVGDVLAGTNERVLHNYVGVRTAKGKRTVILATNEQKSIRQWNASTQVSVHRSAN